MFKPLIALTLAVSGLTACLFDDDSEKAVNPSLTMSGLLADLDTTDPVTPDTNGPTYSTWFLPIDTAEVGEVRGENCFYNAYLGDTVQMTYTNSFMSGQRAWHVIRPQGLTLYRDITEPVYTRYEVVFECFAS